MEIRDIYSALNNAGISSGDTVMIHGDAMIAAQLVSIPKELRLSYFFEAIISYLGPNEHWLSPLSLIALHDLRFLMFKILQVELVLLASHLELNIPT